MVCHKVIALIVVKKQGMQQKTPLNGMNLILNIMRNIHILQTPNPSRLLRNGKELLLVDIPKNYTFFGGTVSVNIYITSDEPPKLDEWGVNNRNGVLFKCKGFTPDTEDKKYDRKIILTTDEYLIRNGVQAIPDEFLEWYVATTTVA
jgi:hypothetical protein